MPAIVAMPNLVGQNAAVAEDRLKKAGFADVRFGSADPDAQMVIHRQNWTVTKQSHKPGTKVSAV